MRAPPRPRQPAQVLANQVASARIRSASDAAAAAEATAAVSVAGGAAAASLAAAIEALDDRVTALEPI